MLNNNGRKMMRLVGYLIIIQSSQISMYRYVNHAAAIDIAKKDCTNRNYKTIMLDNCVDSQDQIHITRFYNYQVIVCLNSADG